MKTLLHVCICMCDMLKLYVGYVYYDIDRRQLSSLQSKKRVSKRRVEEKRSYEVGALGEVYSCFI